MVEVRKTRAGRVAEHSNSGGLSNVLEGPVSAVSIEPVREPGGLANIKVVEPVAINVAHRHAIVPVDIDAGRAVEHRAPIIDAPQHLLRVRRSAAERTRADVGVPGLGGSAARLLSSLPASQAILIRRRRIPFQIPPTYALLAVATLAP